MIKEVLQELDTWIQRQNQERKSEGTLLLGRAVIRVLGQTALLEANLNIEILGTADVDAYIEGDYVIRKKLDELLNTRGRFLDPDSEKIWMPEETEYRLIYKGEFTDGYLAHHDYVLISKALKAPQRNRNLIIAYLADEPSKEFFKLAKKYHLDLEKFL